MKPEIKTEWLRRLRSGEYKQGRNFLKFLPSYSDTPEYCCLGVLCDMAEEAGIVKSHREEDDAAESPYAYDEINDILPGVVMKWAELESKIPQVVFDDCPTNLADLNDIEGLSFDEIADVIEGQL